MKVWAQKCSIFGTKKTISYLPSYTIAYCLKEWVDSHFKDFALWYNFDITSQTKPAPKKKKKFQLESIIRPIVSCLYTVCQQREMFSFFFQFPRSPKNPIKSHLISWCFIFEFEELDSVSRPSQVSIWGVGETLKIHFFTSDPSDPRIGPHLFFS